ncbi:MAG: hypothetical protein ACI9BW_004099 [Gammaproteobacteria bacterium]|jgi:hypothetical protein
MDIQNQMTVITHHRIRAHIKGKDFVRNCRAFDERMFVRLTAVTVVATHDRRDAGGTTPWMGEIGRSRTPEPRSMQEQLPGNARRTQREMQWEYVSDTDTILARVLVISSSLTSDYLLVEPNRSLESAQGFERYSYGGWVRTGIAAEFDSDIGGTRC